MMTTSRTSKHFQSLARGVKGVTSALGYETILGKDVHQFKLENFDPESYINSKCQSMNEKAIRRLCAELSDHKRISTEEMRRSVYANYKAFIKTAREISDLEGSLVALRKLLSSHSDMIQALSETAIVKNDIASQNEDDYFFEEPECTESEMHAAALSDALTVLIAERRVEDSLAILEEGDAIVNSAEAGQPGCISRKSAALLKDALSEKRAELAEQLAELIQHPCVSRSDLRMAASSMHRLGDSFRAHTLLLCAYSYKMHKSVEPMRPTRTSYGTMFCTSICRTIFSGISCAARDSAEIFGTQPCYASELALWAHCETEWCSKLLQKHTTSSAAAAGGLRSAAESVQVALGFARQLESQGLSLSSVLSRILRPDVLNALHANLERIRESTTAMAAADDWVLQNNLLSLPIRHSRFQTSASTNLKLTSSALRLYSMAQELLEDVEPLVNLQLTDLTLSGLGKMFDEYLALLNNALEVGEGWDNPEKLPMVKRAEHDWQQLALIANAYTLAEELPRLASRILHSQSQTHPQSQAYQRPDTLRSAVNGFDRNNIGPDVKRVQITQLKKQMQKGVERLRLAYSSRKATDILFTDDDQNPILPTFYFNLDVDDPYLSDFQPAHMPSDPIQQFFFVVNSISHTASEVLQGRDRLVLQILTQFAIALLTFVCHDAMWEDENLHLGPLGLQQFLLDIHFVKEVSLKYHFGSRQLQQLADMSLQQARDAFDPTGSGLDDETYKEMALEAIMRLTQSEDYTYLNDYSNKLDSSDPLSPRSLISSIPGSEFQRN